MATPTLADKLTKAPFSRNARVIPKREKMHPVLKDAHAAFNRLHSSKFAMNAGRGFKKSK